MPMTAGDTGGIYIRVCIPSALLGTKMKQLSTVQLPLAVVANPQPCTAAFEIVADVQTVRLSMPAEAGYQTADSWISIQTCTP